MPRTRPLACMLSICLLQPVLGIAWEKSWDAPKPSDTCAPDDARYSEAPLFRVAPSSPKERVHFFSKKAPCPNDAAACDAARMKAYLIEGDVVFGGPEDKGYRCVYYGTRKGTLLAGFLRADQLKPFAEKDELTQDFLIGTWTYGGNPTIEISAAGPGKVHGKGEALWKGSGGPHIGEFEATASPRGKEMEFKEGDDEYSCKVQLLRRGPYLVSKDNGRCGGANVSFSSILFKKAQTQAKKTR